MSTPEDNTIPIGARLWFRALVVGAALVAFFVQPVIRYANPVTIFESALLIAAGFTMYPYLAKPSANPKLDFIFIILGIGVVGWGVYGLYGEIRVAQATATINDRRCIIIEIEMMRGKPRRNDLPDLFQALGCRPQTTLMPKRSATPKAD